LGDNIIGKTVQHYRIDQRLGAGGMGEVFRAEDIRLGRHVALKFLPLALKSDPESRARLLTEARAASMLRSPNIAVTYDIGEYSGSDFIVMEYVEGELLSQRVSKGPLPIRETIEVGLQVADALDEAHSRGIIHRDIKSANLMRTERGLVKVLDFGLAKFIDERSSDIEQTQQQVTVAGMVLGTVSYMAPEQALGRPVDHRSDIFSLGVVLFELATGRMPFTGGSPTEIIDHILHDVPPPPSRYTTQIPPGFDAIVTHALEKDPAFRYQSAREVRDDLRGIARDLDGTPRGTTSRIAASLSHATSAVDNSVAVMTFSNITREPADDWIGTGIAETVSSDLKNIHGLTVIGRARVFDALRNLSSASQLDESLAIDIGRRLGATWVVVGGFQRLGDLVRITANFVDVQSGQVRQTVKVDGRIGDIFVLQDKIVYELTQGLNVALRGTEVADIERRETKSVEAYESYARGMMNLRLATRDSIERSISEFEEATRHDPEYAMAWAALGGAYSLKGSFLSLQDLVLKGMEMERRALSIDPDLSDAHSWLGSALLNLGRVDEALTSIHEAIRLDPGNGQAHQALARAYWVGKGDFAAAIPVFERSIALNPEAGYSYLQLGLLLSWEGRYAEAERVLRRAVDLQDQFISGNAGLQMVGANARLGYVYYLQGRYADAIREYERGMAFLETSDHALKERSVMELDIKLGAAYQRSGQPAQARRHFERAFKTFEARVAKGADDPFTRYYIADLHALRGETDRAFDSLTRVAALLPALTASRIRRDPDLESLRPDPRFAALQAPALAQPEPSRP
jgi:serine/threonine protein kinase/Tfp pilus assembly protein PilF